MVITSRDANGESSTEDAAELARSIHGIVLSLFRQLQSSVEIEGISKGQFLAMHALSGLDSASVGTVARRLAVTAPTACVTVDQLEEAGLVTRQRSTRDHRTVEVSLTPKGREVESRVWARIELRIAEAAGDLSSDDVVTAVRVFHELDRRLDCTPYVPGERA